MSLDVSVDVAVIILYPELCRNFKPYESVCGETREQALDLISTLVSPQTARLCAGTARVSGVLLHPMRVSTQTR